MVQSQRLRGSFVTNPSTRLVHGDFRVHRRLFRSACEEMSEYKSRLRDCNRMERENK